MTFPLQELAALRALLPLTSIATARWAAARLDQIALRAERGSASERSLAECRQKVEDSLAAVERRKALPFTLTFPELLPVSQRRDEIVALLGHCPSFVLTGETGSGKTTQLPKMLLAAGYGRRGLIALTQPRRVAAVAMARRLREELSVGENVVAHSVRFDDRATEDTLIRVMTDGLLLAEAAADPELSRYDAIIIDEAHERSLNIDLLLGLVKILRKRRPELVVLVSSASIEADRFAIFLGEVNAPAPVVAVSGRTFPVEIRHQQPSDDDIGYLDAAVSAIRQIHDELGAERGDVLCFLPTERDILDARRRLAELPNTTVLPLFGRLTPHEQQRVFLPTRGRKIVLATNVAETSLTIPGIRVVVDTGLARFKRFQVTTRTERLPIEAVSRASLTQRAGRAGRVEAGICIRLFGAEDAAARDAFTTPEILRSNLAGVVLTCLNLGLGDPEDLPWLDAPSPHAWRKARELLDELGVFDQQGLSTLGRRCAAIPADPQVARILLAGVEEGVAHEACTIAAFLSVQDPRVRPVGQETKADAAHRSFAHEAGDIATVLRLWDRWQAATSNSAKSHLSEQLFLGSRRMREWADVRHQLWQALRSRRSEQHLPNTGHAPDEWPLDGIHRAVLAGMLGNVLMYDREERAYRGAGNRLLQVHPGSALRSGKQNDKKKSPPPPPWLVACEVVETSRLYARLCAPIDPLWVIAYAGSRVSCRHRDPHWHAQRRQVVCTETVTWKGLPIREGRLVPYERVDPLAAMKLFIAAALCGDDEVLRDFPLLARNRRILEDTQRLRHRLRDPGLFIDESLLEIFYSDVLKSFDMAIIASSDALRRWITRHGADRLTFDASFLVPAEQVTRAERDFPESVLMGGVNLRLDYHYAPGSPVDGATLALTEDDIAALDCDRLERLVPGWLPEMIAVLIEQLPKDIRRHLIPLADSAVALAEIVAQDARPLTVALATAVTARLGTDQRHEPVTPASFTLALLPAHLRLRFRIRDVAGTLIYEGRDPAFIATQAAAASDRLLALKSQYDTAPSASWPGDCPGEVRLHGITGYIAISRARDEQGLPAARRTVYASAVSAAAWHDDGIDALLEASFAKELEKIALAKAPLVLSGRCERGLNNRVGALRRGLALAVLRSVARPRISNRAAWLDLHDRAALILSSQSQGFDPLLEQIITRVETLRCRLKQGAKNLLAAAALRHAARHLDRLVGPAWTARLPWSGLQRLDAWLDGIGRLLERTGTHAAETQRACQRREALLDAWDSAIDHGHRRLGDALGLNHRMRERAQQLEECLLAANGGPMSSGAGFSEARLRDGLSEIAGILTAATDRMAQGRERLQHTYALTARLTPGRMRDRLQADCGRLTADFPDLGLGCDLEAQWVAIQALEDRIKLALTARHAS